MDFKNYTLEALDQLCRNDGFLTGNVAVISPARLASQLKNPAAHPDDVVLTVAYDEHQRVAGFIGALPAVIHGERCAWNSCWWVREETAANVSMQLLALFIQNWKQKVLFSEMTPLTMRIIRQLGFCDHTELKGFRGYYRMALAKVLPSKYRFFSSFKGLLRFTDSLLNNLLELRSVWIDAGKVEPLHCKVINTLSDADREVLERFGQQNPAQRSVDEFNWIIKNPWLAEHDKADSIIDRSYPFSYAVDRFKSRWVRFYDEQTVLALVNFTVRDNELKLPYVFCQPGTEHAIAAFFTSYLIGDVKLATITTFHQGLIEAFNQKKCFLFRARPLKYSAIAKAISGLTENKPPELQMGDGDAVFT